MYLHRAESPQHAVPQENLDKARGETDSDQCDQDQARGAHDRGPPHDHRLPWDEQHKRQPEDAMSQCRDLGRDGRTGGKGNYTGRPSSKENYEQRHVRAATRAPQAADLADPAPDHSATRDGRETWTPRAEWAADSTIPAGQQEATSSREAAVETRHMASATPRVAAAGSCAG